MKKRLLVTGASGMLGGYLCRRARTSWRVWGTALSHPAEIPEVAVLGADAASILPCRQADRPMAAARPRDVSLDSRWTYSVLKTFPPSLETQIRQILYPAGGNDR